MANDQTHVLPWTPNEELPHFVKLPRFHYGRSTHSWGGVVSMPRRESYENSQDHCLQVESRGEFDVFVCDNEWQVPFSAPTSAPQTLKPQYSLFRIIMTHDYTSRSSAPTRGLYNTNNMCFFNSVLQALIHCAPLNALFKDIYANTAFSIKSSTPVLDSLVLFNHRYDSVGTAKPASADDFYSVVCNHPKFHVQRDRQEDAQEFLAYLLDELESNFGNASPSEEDSKDDLKAVRREIADEAEGDDGWQEVGKGSKAVQMQHVGKQDRDNPIQELFGGRLRSVLIKKGTRQASVTTEPFLQVPVDISGSNVSTVQQAIDQLLHEEELMVGPLPATKRLEFERMPPVLIIHLKRFTFINLGGTFDFGKITKPIAIDDTLTAQCGFEEAVYRPFAVVYHHGQTATRGHYTTEVLKEGHWYHIDDEQVTRDSSNSGLSLTVADEESKAVYMVFYERTQ